MSDGMAQPGSPIEVHQMDRPQDADIEQLYGLWLAKRGGRTVPARGDLDPAAFRRLLPNIMLVDVLPPPDIYRVRLSGEAINEFYGGSIAGRTPRGYLSADGIQVVAGLTRALVEQRQPIFRAGRVHWQSDKTYKLFESCLLPLAADGETVDMVLAAIKFD
jgi:hypothetical protein